MPSLYSPIVPPPPLDISARCLPASDYLVLGTGYSVLGTRYPVYSPTTTIGEHTATGRRHPEATAFVPFVLVRLLILPQAGWGIPSSRFLEEEMHRAKTSRAHALYLLPFVFLFFLFSFSSSSFFFFFVLSSPRVASLRESSSSHPSIRLFEEQARKRTCLFVRMT